MREFATFDRSVINLVLISMGEFGAWEELYLISPLVGSLFFFSYLAIVTVLMMNIILAIVVDSFEVAAVASEGATSVFHDMAVTFMVDIHLFCKLVSCTLPSKSAHLNSNSSASFALVVCMERICGKCCKRSGACAGKRRGKHCFALWYVGSGLSKCFFSICCDHHHRSFSLTSIVSTLGALFLPCQLVARTALMSCSRKHWQISLKRNSGTCTFSLSRSSNRR